MNKTARRLILPALLLSVPAGIAGGIGGYTFVYAKGGSYLTNDPAACANCHVMQGHFDDWLKSSHHSVATCNDCHTPSSTIPKYVTKASNGWHHSRAFTTGDFHEPIAITPRNREIVEGQCRHCHAEIVDAIEHDFADSCVRCHASVGHPR
jgi:cytochrome c nitrite reductase small subunit